jgi:hypothetical protein
LPFGVPSAFIYAATPVSTAGVSAAVSNVHLAIPAPTFDISFLLHLLMVHISVMLMSLHNCNRLVSFLVLLRILPLLMISSCAYFNIFTPVALFILQVQLLL